MKYIFFSILTALAFSFCRTPETTTKRTLSTYVRYLADVKRLRAEASYAEGAPNPQPVEMVNGFRFQGQAMKLKATQNATYQLEQMAAEYPPKFTFDWSDARGTAHQFDLAMAPLIQFGFLKEPLSIHEANTFQWTGGSLENGEVFVFLWENIETGENVKMEIFQNSVKPEIKFPAAKLAELKPGNWKLYLVRKKLTKGNVDGIDISGVTEFYSKTDTIQVLK